MRKKGAKRSLKATKTQKPKEDFSLSQSQAEFLYTLVRCQNNSGEGVTTEKLAEGMRALGHPTYTENSTMIPRLVHQLRKAKKIPIVNLPAELPDGQISQGYGLENFLIVTLPRTGQFLMQFRGFANDEEGGRPAEKDLGKFREYLLSNGFSHEEIESDIKFTLDQNYLMAFPNPAEPTHLRARNRLAYELRYLRLLAKSPNASQQLQKLGTFSLGKEVRPLSKPEAQVLFAVWKMEQRTGLAPTFEAIRQELNLSPKELEITFHRLEAVKWPVLKPFNNPDADRTYRLLSDKVVGWPRTAAMLVLLGEGRYHEDDGLPYQFNRSAFVRFAAQTLKESPHDLHTDLDYVAKNKYIKLIGEKKDCFWPDERLDTELSYLKLIAEQHKPNRASSLKALSPEHAKLLMTVWKFENWAERRDTPPEAHRPVMTFQTISEELNHGGTEYSEMEVKCLIQEIFTYQWEHRSLWPAILQYDADDPAARTGIKFVAFSLVTYPESAALILNLANQVDVRTAFQECKQRFQHFDRDMEFFEVARYIMKVNSQWEITERVQAEWLYLESVATKYTFE